MRRVIRDNLMGEPRVCVQFVLTAHPVLRWPGHCCNCPLLDIAGCRGRTLVPRVVRGRCSQDLEHDAAWAGLLWSSLVQLDI